MFQTWRCSWVTSKAQALLPSDLSWQRNATAAPLCLLFLFIIIPLCILATRTGVKVEEGDAGERQLSINAGVFSTSGLTMATLSNTHSLSWSYLRSVRSVSVSSSERADVHTPHLCIAFSSTGASRKGLCFQSISCKVECVVQNG